MDITLSSPERLQTLLTEAEEELSAIQPEIEALEEQIATLKELKLKKQRLLTLKMSLSAMLESFKKDEVLEDNASGLPAILSISETKLYDYKELSTLKTFHPDEALKQVDQFLKQKGSLNYDLYKAVVFQGGKANTEEIRNYLVSAGITQPQTGESFEKVPLTEISSRINYLVRKGVLAPAERGSFFTTLGWCDPE